MYTAHNNSAILEIVNESDQDQILYLEKPLEVDRFNIENFHVSHSMQTCTNNNKAKDENPIKKDDLNTEKKTRTLL